MYILNIMKIKDLLKFNPEAEIEIIMPNCLPFEGKLNLGWSHGGDESDDSSEETATEVCIFLCNIKEKES